MNPISTQNSISNVQHQGELMAMASPENDTGEKAAGDLLKLIRVGVQNGDALTRTDENNRAAHGYANLMKEHLNDLTEGEQRAFIYSLVNRNATGELDEQLRTTNFKLGPTIGAMNVKHENEGNQVTQHLKSLFESGELSKEDIKQLFHGEDLRYTGREFTHGGSPAEGLSRLAKNVGNGDFSQAAVSGLLMDKPQGDTAGSVYEAAVDIARDGMNAGQPHAAFDLVEKAFTEPGMRDDMIKQLEKGGRADDGRSGLLGLVNDLDNQNKALGKMDAHFGGKGTAADRLEHIWQGTHEHIAGDENAVKESNEYFTNNLARLNKESRHIGGASVNENDDGKLISDYVKNVFLDETVDLDKVNHKEALQAIVDQRVALMDEVKNGTNENARLTAAGDLGNLIGSVGNGLDRKFRDKVSDTNLAADIAATTGWVIIDAIPIVGPLAETTLGDMAQNATKLAMKKTISATLPGAMKPGESPIFEGMQDNIRRQLPDPSNPEKDAKENAFNAQLHREFGHSILQHDVRSLNNAANN